MTELSLEDAWIQKEQQQRLEELKYAMGDQDSCSDPTLLTRRIRWILIKVQSALSHFSN